MSVGLNSKMQKSKPKCFGCTDRERLVKEYGNCHNEHCPNGWRDYEIDKELEYAERERRFNSPNKIKHTNRFYRIVKETREKK